MFKVFAIAIAIIGAFQSAPEVSQQRAEDVVYEHSVYDSDYEETLVQNISEKFGGRANIWDADELSPEALGNRNGEVIIERMLGRVIDKQGNGRVLNPWDSDCNYISYSNVEDLEVGEEYVTYVVYNPKTNEPDDIVERFDVRV